MDCLLEIKNLTIAYRTGGGHSTTAVDGVSLNLSKGESLGLVGESGSGKSTIGAAVMGLLPRNAEIVSGEILFNGEDLLRTDAETLRQLRWKQLSMIFQAAMNALNPIQRVGDQIVEAIRVHEPETGPTQALGRVETLFHQMGIPLERLRHFPHQYSGGMRQRAIIAMALACNPQLIIADEPTTALDVIVQDQILKTILALQKELSLAILFISHDIAVIADVCHHVGVMYAGQIVEIGSSEEVFATPGHPYTQALLGAHITLSDDGKAPRAIMDNSNDTEEVDIGCRFAPRCLSVKAECHKTAPQWLKRSETHWIRCPMAPAKNSEA